MGRKEDWLKAREYTPELLELAQTILEEVRAGSEVAAAVRRHPRPEGGYVGKHVLVAAYRRLVAAGTWSADQVLLRSIRMKPGRTLSGVTTVTVLTKPAGCPGDCLFCPDEERMPKSYIEDEPGAMRAAFHDFDPFEQVAARIEALEAIGHPTDKIELLILGGTWSAYAETYQEWFIQRCLDAMNGFESTSLAEAQQANEDAAHRNVGLVLETRPDWVTEDEMRRMRRLGATKIQLGAQSMDDHILELNHRGHDVAATRQAMRLLRAAGFKLVLHWMPNLLGATLESDRLDFALLWANEAIRPDELKIYPCVLLRTAPLYEYWQRGEFIPYEMDDLITLIADIKPSIPRYCRVNRVVRDIPSDHVVAGSKRTSLRQDVQQRLRQTGRVCQCIRCREVRGEQVSAEELILNDLVYPAGGAEEHFLSYDTAGDRLAGYLRLSLPGVDSAPTGLADLQDAALIREVHIYGQSLEVGREVSGVAQHSGLGSTLIQRAEQIAREKGFTRIAVISALGTRGYYHKLGYRMGEMYMLKDLG